MEEEEEAEDWRIGGLRWGNDIVLLGRVGFCGEEWSGKEGT